LVINENITLAEFYSFAVSKSLMYGMFDWIMAGKKQLVLAVD